ncbi:MAG: prolyl oligopeptidase family serine peptidase [Planctomycetales bacterium]|nr:prolyl oligopeptidase family serine peptidase [Planctomycetales bacterium]
MRMPIVLNFAALLWIGFSSVGLANGQLAISNVRQVFDNGEHNAFTDLIQFHGTYYLTFRSCPDGHMVHPTSSIVVLASDDLNVWRRVHQFSVAQRDTRDPHFLNFQGKLFVYTGTWYCGQNSPARGEYDLNQHLGYAVYSENGRDWSQPKMLEGTYGHYIWRANAFADRAYLCGRRKYQFDALHRNEGATVESAMLESDDGLIWRTRSLFQSRDGDETAFQFQSDGSVLGIARRGRGPAEIVRSLPPYAEWNRTPLDVYIGGPMLAQWSGRWIVGGRRMVDGEPPCTALYWLDGNNLQLATTLPSGGDNSYPGLVAIDNRRAVISWYSTHEASPNGTNSTSIYMADLTIQDDLPSNAEKRVSKQKFFFKSSFDGTQQATYLTVPQQDSPTSAEVQEQVRLPMVVSLHSWSADLEQEHPELEHLVASKNWYCLQPNFRGVNDDPLACGSAAAQQDIIDAVDWAIQHYPVDSDRVFLTGNSGGGHMTLMMAAKYPQRWAAASAWVGISDMAAWYKKHQLGRYGEMMRLCCGGAPGDSTAVDEQYRLRSPLYFLANARDVALDIAAGIHDGHAGSVPVSHSINAFNKIAQANDAEQVSAAEMEQLSVDNGRLRQPHSSDQGTDPAFAREFYLRRQAGRTRLTIFEGGHEGIASAAMAWFEAHPRRIPSSSTKDRK